MKVTLSKNGEIKVGGNVIGKWNVCDLWKNGRMDMSGNLKVHYLWEFLLDNGYGNVAYSREEVINEIMMHI